MRYKRVTERQIYWREQLSALKSGFFPFLVYLLAAFALGVAFGLGTGKGLLVAVGAE